MKNPKCLADSKFRTLAVIQTGFILAWEVDSGQVRWFWERVAEQARINADS
jgi:hypothetical protein